MSELPTLDSIGSTTQIKYIFIAINKVYTRFLGIHYMLIFNVKNSL